MDTDTKYFRAACEELSYTPKQLESDSNALRLVLWRAQVLKDAAKYRKEN